MKEGERDPEASLPSERPAEGSISLRILRWVGGEGGCQGSQPAQAWSKAPGLPVDPTQTGAKRRARPPPCKPVTWG